MRTRTATAAAFGAALVLLAAQAPSAQRGQSAQAVLTAATSAMGNARTVEFTATGYDFALGQAYSPDSPWPRFINIRYSRAVDFERGASRVDRVRIQGENPARGGGQQPVRGEQTQNQVIGSSSPWVQQLEVVMLPHGFLRAATARNATMTSRTIAGKKYSVVSFTGDNKAQVNGYINADNVVEWVETWFDDAWLGDTHFEAVYSDYRDVGGVKFPGRILQNQAGYPVFDLRVGDIRPNTAVTIPAPPAAAAPAPVTAPTEKLADGIYLARGGYASLIVDFKNYIVIVEGGQSEERSEAVIAAAKQLIPGKRIRYLVNTHHHIDHSRGVRTFVAEGATVVTHAINRPYFEKMFAAPHTLNPDRLQKAKRAATFETFTTKKVMTDGTKVIEIHHMPGHGHNAGLSMIYLPKEKILVEADAYNPAAQPNAPVVTPVSPYTENLVTLIDKLKLDVDTIVPIHLPGDNRRITRAELMRVAGRS